MSYKERIQINCSRSGKASLCKVVTDYKNDDSTVCYIMQFIGVLVLTITSMLARNEQKKNVGGPCANYRIQLAV